MPKFSRIESSQDNTPMAEEHEQAQGAHTASDADAGAAEGHAAKDVHAEGEHLQGHEGETHTRTVEHTDHHEAGHHGPFYADPTFWVAVAFFLLMFVIWKYMRGQILAGLDGRGQAIRQRLEEATRLRDEAKETLETYKQKQKEAMDEAREIIERAKQQAEEIQKKSEADFMETMVRREKQAMDRIAFAETQALQEVQNQAIDIAMETTRQLLQEKLGDAESEELLAETLKALPDRLN